MLNWTAIYHDLFELDEGALPGITISNLTGDEIVRIYAHLRSRGEISSVNPYFWHKELQSEQPIDSVPNAAELVVSEKAESFHHCVRWRATNGIEIPDLGIFVDPDCIALDYRRGSDWNPAKVEALFHLLFDIAQMAPRANFALDDEVHISETVAFAKVWDEFLATTH